MRWCPPRRVCAILDTAAVEDVRAGASADGGESARLLAACPAAADGREGRSAARTDTWGVREVSDGFGGRLHRVASTIT
jgi:hypothetical protein